MRRIYDRISALEVSSAKPRINYGTTGAHAPDVGCPFVNNNDVVPDVIAPDQSTVHSDQAGFIPVTTGVGLKGHFQEIKKSVPGVKLPSEQMLVSRNYKR